MASKVNMKFVLGLGAGLLVLLAVVVYVGAKAISADGAQQITKGDEAMAANDIPKAIMYYGRAVNKDKGNGPWIRKWLGALEKSVPDTQSRYEEAYRASYLVALNALCDAERTNVETYQRFLEERYQLTRQTFPSLAGWESFVKEYEERIKFFQGDEKGKNALRRFRGLGVYGQLIANSQIGIEALDSGLDDLKAALAVNPNDEDAVVAASGIELAKASRARGLDRATEAETLEKSAETRLAEMVKAVPTAQRARMELAQFELAKIAKTMPQGATRLDLLKAAKPVLKEIVDSMLANPPEKTSIESAMSLAPLWAIANGDMKAMDPLLEHVAKGYSDNGLFLLAWAKLERQRGDATKAIEIAQRVVELKDRPLSMQGLMINGLRSEAIKTQVDAAWDAWSSERDPAKREQWVQVMKDKRKDLAARLGEGSAPLLSIDGRMELIKDNIPGARTLITAYNAQTGENDESMVAIEADLLARQGQKGIAKDKFKRVLQLNRQNIRALAGLGQIEMEDSNYREAYEHLSLLALMQPENAALQTMAKTVQEMATGNTKDPVAGTLIEVQKAMSGLTGDTTKAIGILREGLKKSPGEARLTVMMANLLFQTGDVAGARTALDAGLAKNPENQLLKQMRSRVDQDPIVAALESIDKSNQTDVVKNLSRYDVLMRANRPEEARKYLEEAVKIAPEDPRVFELAFTDAMIRKDLPRIERLAKDAERLNIDRAGGLVFKARASIAAGRIEEAIGILTDLVGRDKLNLPGWRLLGMSLLDQGKTPEAVNALRTAVGIKPDDSISVVAYLKALIRQGQLVEALDVARKSESRLAGDPDFAEIALALEQQAPGGDPNKAVQARKVIAQRKPADRSNRSQLASALVNANRLDEAEAEIKTLRSEDPSDPIAVQIEASWKAKKGDTAAAVALLKQFIESQQKEKRSESLYINTGRLILQLGNPDEAMKVLDEGRQYQDAKLAMVDREIGDMNFQIQRYDKAAEAYVRVLGTGGEDTGNAVRKRIVECYLANKNYAGMEKVIDEMGPSGKTDPTVILLQAEAASGQNDRQRAISLYNAAVAADPKNPVVYLKRGDFRAADESGWKDAEADYEQMVRVAPQNVVGRVRLVRMARMRGDDARAVSLLRETVDIEPENETLRLALPRLFEEIGRLNDAAEAYEAGAQRFPGNTAWNGRAAQAWARVNRWDKAREHLLKIWAVRKAPDIGLTLVEATLRAGDATGAENILNSTDVQGMSTSLPGRLLRAQIQSAQGRTADAARTLGDALGMVDPNNRESCTVFMNCVSQLYPKVPDQLAALTRLETRTKFTGFLALRAAELRARQPELKDAAIKSLEELAESAATPVRAAVWTLLGAMSYQDKKWDEATERFRKGLQYDPESPELNNNLSFLLSVKLNKCDEALPFAEKALKANPMNSGFWDTLGAVYLCKKDYDKALQVLLEGMNKALNDAERVPLQIHLARARLGKGDKVEARRLSVVVKDLLLKQTALAELYQTDVQELDRAIDAP
ncbi:MAG: tetratricopeptide repeat protein [Phycisphaerales bacterium]|nr:tetratricopeptide repeat protein [Phycisphaerales bacterium]